MTMGLKMRLMTNMTGATRSEARSGLESATVFGTSSPNTMVMNVTSRMLTMMAVVWAAAIGIFIHSSSGTKYLATALPPMKPLISPMRVMPTWMEARKSSWSSCNFKAKRTPFLCLPAYWSIRAFLNETMAISLSEKKPLSKMRSRIIRMSITYRCFCCKSRRFCSMYLKYKKRSQETMTRFMA